MRPPEKILERRRWTGMLITGIASASLIQSCSDVMTEYPEEMEKETIMLSAASPDTRAIDPDEMKISDINVFVFNEYGVLEASAYFNGVHNSGENLFTWEVDLVKNGMYSVFACANFGYALNISNIDELKEIRYYLAYPDDYSLGIPMSGQTEMVRVTGDGISVKLERLMAKIYLMVDRSRLYDDVEFLIRSVQVEGCPRSVYPFSRNHIRDPFDFFPSGFLRSDYEADALNTADAGGRSGEICLYMLENMQGDLLPGNTDEKKKVLPENEPAKGLCSYIEIKAEYISSSGYSKPGEYLIYRFYPGENPSNFDVCRNTAYRICISPAGYGLDGTEWRIDKSGMEISGQTLELSYTDIHLTYEGEKMQIQTFLTPGDITSADLVWESDDPSVATVSDRGEVTAVSEGLCTVTCRAAGDSRCSAECQVTAAFLPYYLKVFPGQFIRCRKGDAIRIECEYFPEDTPFDIGREELEYDKSRGIYDYRISDDGKSVTIYTKARGTGLLYMEAGYPVNDEELVVLVID